MQTEKYLLLVSDGSLKHIHMMAFGWILCTPSGKWLAAASGPGSGEGSSLRIEADGMLSGALFCGIVSDDIILPEFRIKYICDNKNLIDNCIERLEYTLPFPNTYLLSEFDLIEEIYQTNKKYNISSSFLWIKGHQDDTTDEEDLPIEATLNIAADKLAKDWNEEHGRVRLDPKSLLVPANSASLLIQGSLVTSHYYKRLNDAYTLPRYHRYLQDRFKWNDSTIQDIAWKCLKNSIIQVKRPVLTTKISNRILAVNHIQFLRKHTDSNTCKHCNCIETVSHLYHCNHHSRIQWRLTYITALRNKLKELKTQESLIDAMASILTEYLDTGMVDRSKYSKRY